MTKINGKLIKIAEADESHDVALKRWHEIHANMDAPVDKMPPTVAAVLDEFLGWAIQNQEVATYRWYLNYLRKFHAHVGSGLLVASLKPLHVQRWVQADYKDASNNNKRGAIRAVKRAINWAVDMGIVSSNPIARMRKPAYEPREEYLTQERFLEVLELIKSPSFRDDCEGKPDVECRSVSFS